jgi:5-methylcytosine-specific restriction endonuclease McrA
MPKRKHKRGKMADNLEYLAYLRSPQWQAKRERILTARGHRCEVCRHAERLSLHHISYARLYDERDSDLLVVCESCHAAMHSRWHIVRAIGANQHERYIRQCVEQHKAMGPQLFRRVQVSAVESVPWVWDGKPPVEKPKTRRRPMAETPPLKDKYPGTLDSQP